MKLVRGVYSRNDMLVRGVRSRNVKQNKFSFWKKVIFYQHGVKKDAHCSASSKEEYIYARLAL